MCRIRCEDEKSKLEQRIDDIIRDRESAQNEIENLKVQLHLTEDKTDDLGNQLNDAIRKLKECNTNQS